MRRRQIFFAAVDTATGPSQTIIHDLPRRFRMWVESVKVPDMAYRPLNGIIHNSKTLNFNYTEFIEDLYGVKKRMFAIFMVADEKKNTTQRIS